MNRFDTRNIKNKAIKYLLVLLIIFSYYFILKKTNLYSKNFICQWFQKNTTKNKLSIYNIPF